MELMPKSLVREDKTGMRAVAVTMSAMGRMENGDKCAMCHLTSSSTLSRWFLSVSRDGGPRSYRSAVESVGTRGPTIHILSKGPGRVCPIQVQGHENNWKPHCIS